METNFICPKCGNSDPKFIGLDAQGRRYCRLCVNFKGKNAEYNESRYSIVTTNLKYQLSQEQKELSKQLLNNYQNGINSFVYAVCGSGKTEIVIETIKYVMTIGYKCGFALPRRDVAIELAERFKEIFPNKTITAVYGGNTDYLYGDLVILTTHQLFRYDHYFDLLVLDEVDAFPYKGSIVLKHFFDHSVKGNFIMMSATPETSFLLDFRKGGGEVLTLNKRFHGYPLPVPKVQIVSKLIIVLLLIKCIKKFEKVGKQVFIFTPTIQICEETYHILKNCFKNKIYFVHSKCIDRQKRIHDFKNKKIQFLITTAVLERGVTVEDLQVIVFRAEHPIYDRYCLVQISGRVGRKINAPVGEVIYIATRWTREIKESITSIEASNKDLQNLF